MRKIGLFLLLSALAFAALKVDVKKLLQEAKKGNVEALNQLGFIYENGNGVPKDIQKAIKYYRQAAELGSEDAILALSLLELSKELKDGKFISLTNSVKVEGKGSIDFNLKASDLQEIVQKAKEGDKDALFTLAAIYDNGYGDIKPNKTRAIALYKKAAAAGSESARHILLLMQEKK